MGYKTLDKNQSLAMLLDRSTRAMGTSLQRIFKSSGFDITVEQWMVLLLLWERDGRPQQQIADRIGKDKGTISAQIDGLQRRSLIVRTPDPEDKRRNRVWLTRRGKALEGELVPLGFKNMEIARRGVSEKDLNTCKSVLRRLCLNFEGENTGDSLLKILKQPS